MKTVLLPVKDFRHAKQRLAGTLDPGQRAGVARAMLSDVLLAISRARRPERVVVFTASEEAGSLARPFHFEIVQETAVQGHSAAVNQMVAQLAGGASHLLSLAGDLPTISPDEIDGVFDSPVTGVGLVSSRDGTGTNAALFVSPARIKMEYGEGSLHRHLFNAAAAGFKANVLRAPGIEFDVDTPEDLDLFRQNARTNSHTWSYVSAL